MGAAGLLGLHFMRIYELALHTVVPVWDATGAASGLALGATRARLDLPCLRKRELSVAEVVRLV